METHSPASPRDAVILGVASRFPAPPDPLRPWDGTAAFWRLLHSGGSSFRQIPSSRLALIPHDGAAALLNSPARWGAFLDGVENFDPVVFGISRYEAPSVDPAHRLLLEVVWELLETVGLPAARLRPMRVGVFVGAGNNDYFRYHIEAAGAASLHGLSAIGGMGSSAAGRIAHTFGLAGPVLVVDTACSSSLVAAHLAAKSIRQGECDLAIAAGVKVFVSPTEALAMARLGAISPRGHPAIFTADADGFVQGEGCGAVLLATSEIARTHALAPVARVCGSAINHEAGKHAYGMPSVEAQCAVIDSALRDAGIAAADVAYVEAHATGGRRGDAIEREALSRVYGETARPHPLLVGSVKGNVGNLVAAGGIAGLIKVVLALQHRHIPPHPSPAEPGAPLGAGIDLAKTPQPWPRGFPESIAGVSSFGLSGTNAHMLLRAAMPPPRAPTRQSGAGAGVLCLSAASAPALTDLAKRYATWLGHGEGDDWELLCRTAAHSRTHLRHRLAIVADDAATARTALDRAATGQIGPGTHHGVQPRAARRAQTPQPFQDPEALARAYAAGQTIDWEGSGLPASAPNPHAPTYAFARQRHWVERAPAPRAQPSSRRGDPPSPSAEPPSLDDVARLWRHCLARESLDADAGFVQLGGTSLSAAAVTAALSAALGRTLSPSLLLDNPTLQTFTQRLHQVRTLPSIAVQPAQDTNPASHEQARLWWEQRRSDGNPSPVIAGARRLTGCLHLPTLEAAWQDVTAAHPILRTTFGEHEGRIEARTQPALPAAWRTVDLSRDGAPPTGAAWDEALRRCDAMTDERFDLARGPLLHCCVFKLGPTDHALFIKLHHAIADAASAGHLVRQLGAFYAARRQQRPPHTAPDNRPTFADYARWEHQRVASAAFAAAQAFWQRCLDGAVPTILPRDKHPEGKSYRRGLVTDKISGETLAAVRNAQRRSGVTPAAYFTAAFGLFLAHHTDQDDVLFGIAPSVRHLGDLQQTLGFLVNGTIMRVQLPADADIATLLRHTRDTLNAILAHVSIPFSALEQHLDVPHVDAGAPFVQCMVVHHEGRSELGIAEIHEDDDIFISGGTQLDLTITLHEQDDRATIYVEYNANLFAEATVRAFAARFRRAIAWCAGDPALPLAAIDLLCEGEKADLHTWGCGPTLPIEPLWPHFARHCQERPNTLAATDHAGGRVTYAQLTARVEQLGARLTQAGITAGSVVGVTGPPTVAYLVCLLAVLRRRAVYLPLPSNPVQRQNLLTDSRAGWLLDASEELKPIPMAQTGRCIPGAATLVYTSGSSGHPKGVVGYPDGLWNHVQAKVAVLSLDPSDVLAHASPTTFVVSLWQFLAPLWAGARLHLLALHTLADAPALANEVLRHRVSVLTYVPSLLPDFMQALAQRPIPSLRWVVSTGEALTPQLCRQWSRCAPSTRLLNAYGATETHDDVCHQVVQPLEMGDVVPIGRPVANARVVIENARGQPLPLGVPGELVVYGVPASGDYLQPNRGDKGFSLRGGEPAYRTGDVARWRRDGSLAFVGRRDRQMKIRGCRVEPREVERALHALDGVVRCVVALDDQARLAAYVVGDETSEDAIRLALAAQLPGYMIPEVFVWLAALPVGPHGKLRRDALPRVPPKQIPPPKRKIDVDLEARIAQAFARILGLASVDRSGHFFRLGGNSLAAMRLWIALKAELGADVPFHELFAYPTVHALAQRLGDASGAPRSSLPGMGIQRTRDQPQARGIAVLGMACRFPRAANLDRFWQLLCTGGDGITEFSKDDLRAAGVPAEMLQDPRYVRRRGRIDDVFMFDPASFGMSVREAQLMDPQQRLSLEVAYAALEHAGYDPRHALGRVGVYASAAASSYMLQLLPHRQHASLGDLAWAQSGNSLDLLASRIAYALQLQGPAMAIAAGCSSFLVALASACEALQRGACDMALVGAAQINLPSVGGYLHIPGDLWSADGHTRTFDRRASGTVPADGVGYLLLKRLADAQTDRDRVLAIIRGWGLSGDGPDKATFLAPSQQGIMNAVQEACAMAAIEPGSLSYVEASGPATPLGDPIEVAALAQVFRGGTPASCGIGSVKTNIGHAGPAAGAAALIKTILMLQHERLVASLNHDTPNPDIPFAGSPFYVVTENKSWHAPGVRRAGVNTFGLGGTNAHVIVEQAPAPGAPVRAALPPRRMTRRQLCAIGETSPAPNQPPNQPPRHDAPAAVDVAAAVAAAVGIADTATTRQTALSELGLSSFVLVRLLASLRQSHGLHVSPAHLRGVRTFGELIEQLHTHREATPETATFAWQRVRGGDDLRRLHAQLQQLPPRDLNFLDPITEPGYLALLPLATLQEKLDREVWMIRMIDAASGDFAGVLLGHRVPQMVALTQGSIYSLQDFFEIYSAIATPYRNALDHTVLLTQIDRHDVDIPQSIGQPRGYRLSTKKSLWTRQASVLAATLGQSTSEVRRLRHLFLRGPSENAQAVLTRAAEDPARRGRLCAAIGGSTYDHIEGTRLLALDPNAEDYREILAGLVADSHRCLLLDALQATERHGVAFLGIELRWLEPIFVYP